LSGRSLKTNSCFAGLPDETLEEIRHGLARRVIQYVSTRGSAPAVDFRTALLTGLAPDGGLFMPTEWPTFSASEIESLSALPFHQVAAAILFRFAEDWLSEDEAQALTRKAYARFPRDDAAPVRRLPGGGRLLELYHGPTLAFKDVAMQLLGLLFERALAETGEGATILGATSGDTGGAAIEAFRGRRAIDIVILHPLGRVSEVQRRFMTTAKEENVLNIAVEGSFDDCQAIVKSIFADLDFVRRRKISGVNSINWARLAIQTVYYFTSAAALRRDGERRKPWFSVPTGNFGDVFAGYAAMQMGLPVAGFVVAVNENDILRRALETGEYLPQRATPTISPSMDIQVASNFERLLFEASGRDAERVGSLMASFARDGRYSIPTEWLSRIRRHFVASSVSERRCLETIAELHREGVLIDPHTAVGVAAARRQSALGIVGDPWIALSTAHPAKFPDAVMSAAGVVPRLPDGLVHLSTAEEHYIVAPADAGAVKALIDRRKSV